MFLIYKLFYIKKHSDFSIIMDHSCAVGNNYMIDLMCCVVTAAGCDGITVEFMIISMNRCAIKIKL